MSLRRILHAQVVADAPDDDLARVEPDAHGERHAVLGADLARVRAGGVTQMERGVAGALRVILVGDRRAEKRHAAVSGELVDEALEALDAVAEHAEEALHDLRPRLGVELLRQVHRALHVDEEDDDLLALALDRGFRPADLLGEERHMRCRCSRRPPADRQHRAAAAAEFLADRDRCAAGGTAHGQFGAALGAEATVGPVLVVTRRTTHWVSAARRTDRDDRELVASVRRSQRDDVAALCLRERRCDRRDPGDAGAGRIDPLDAGDAHAPLGAGFVRSRAIGADGVTLLAGAPERPCP